MSTKPNQHANAAKLFFDCGHAELKPLNATEYRHVSVGGLCTACRAEQPRPTGARDTEAGEWRSVDMTDTALDARPAITIEQGGRLLATAYSAEIAATILRDHSLAALVQQLVEALELCMMDSDVAAMSGNPIATERYRIARTTLNAIRKEREG